MKKSLKCMDALTLKLMAMTFMLFDHVWATVWSVDWFTMVGRLAFPIFAFQIVEGFYQTHDRKNYMKRLFVFALISEIPMNLMYADQLFYPFQQNVMFTFLIAMVFMNWMERYRDNLWKFVPVSLVSLALGTVLGLLTMVDYHHYGIWMVFLFYWTRGIPFGWVIQLLGMLYINDAAAGLVLSVNLFGMTVEFGQQMLAVLALIPIWMYNGKQGYHSKPLQLACYWFYPVHMTVLYLIRCLLV